MCDIMQLVEVSRLVPTQASHKCRAMGSNNSNSSRRRSSRRRSNRSSLVVTASSSSSSHRCKVMGSSKVHLVVTDRVRCRSILLVDMANKQVRLCVRFLEQQRSEIFCLVCPDFVLVSDPCFSRYLNILNNNNNTLIYLPLSSFSP